MRIQRGMKGFTLIELAIVLVIIGLIIGAILKGGELIQSAKYKRLKMDWDSVLTAVYTYDDKYSALPGDDPNATTNFNPAPTGLVNGGGDGYLGNSGNILTCTSAGISGDEQCQAWWHMRLAGLLPGSETTAPTHSFGGYMAIAGTDAITGINTAWPWAVCHKGLQNKVALWLDEHYDDGESDKGTIRGTSNYNTSPDSVDPTSWTCIKGG